MHRDEIGPLDFVWSRISPKGNEYGIKHIISRRAEQDRIYPHRNKLSPEELCERIPSVLALGHAKQTSSGFEIEHLGIRCIVGSRRKNQNAVLVSAFEVWPKRSR